MLEPFFSTQDRFLIKFHWKFKILMSFFLKCEILSWLQMSIGIFPIIWQKQDFCFFFSFIFNNYCHFNKNMFDCRFCIQLIFSYRFTYWPERAPLLTSISKRTPKTNQNKEIHNELSGCIKVADAQFIVIKFNAMFNPIRPVRQKVILFRFMWDQKIQTLVKQWTYRWSKKTHNYIFHFILFP